MPEFDISKFFARNPREFDDATFEAMIAELRRRRDKIALGDKTAGNVTPKLTDAEKKAGGLNLDIEL